ncbi:MAG TPA: SDR family NAD(P)-dependent oxidoreductase [Thermoanaerobaculia bacterium]|nr:SDR family NAD(P)-dependent oxidoreductase [Thermoanaerobaculia bacterium]
MAGLSGSGGGEPRVALVTGGSRGIGREVARQLAGQGFRVVVTSRKRRPAEAAAREIGDGVTGHQLEASDPESIRALATFVKREIGRVDVLVNNAAVLLADGESILKIAEAAFVESWRANALGPLLLTRELAPLLSKSGAGRVVNVSSGAGQISSMTTYAPAYSISKAALNAITVMLAAALPNAKVNCVDPGWVRTDMGGPGAPRGVEQGADTIVWLATLPASGPTGGFFRDRKPIAW